MSEKEKFEQLEDKLQKMASPGIRPGLARLAHMLAEAGYPQKKFRAVHVAGTNGKGSTSAGIYSIIETAGYKTALFTSPHLVDFSERLIIDGERVSGDKWLDALGRLETIAERSALLKEDPPTYFELLTAAAIMILAEESPDAAVIEVGMGGRLDASNILRGVCLSLIVPIGLDHTEYLGETLEEVAHEKFAIMRKGVPALFAGDPQLNTQFLEYAEHIGAEPHIFTSRYEILDKDFTLNGTSFTMKDKKSGEAMPLFTPLVGTFQAENAALSAAAALLLRSEFPKITPSAVKEGLAKTNWPGRMEIIAEKPLTLIDGGHNPHAMKRVAETLRTLAGDRHVNIVVAMMRDKEIAAALEYLKGLDLTLYCTEIPENGRSLGADDMRKIAESAGLKCAGSFDDPVTALKAAASEGSPVLCCGSLYLVGYIKEHFNGF